MSTAWNRKELWRKFGANFLVEISRHEEPARFPSGCYDEPGPHRWCVYAYIYPKHPHFAAFDGSEDMFQEAACALPLHAGPSFCRKHLNAKGEVTAYQVGADYNHLYDDQFTRSGTPDEAIQVFNDADQLFERLSQIGQREGSA